MVDMVAREKITKQMDDCRKLRLFVSEHNDELKIDDQVLCMCEALTYDYFLQKLIEFHKIQPLVPHYVLKNDAPKKSKK